MAFKGLFIGIDRYASAEINWLSCATRDAKALHGHYTDTLGGDTTLLTDEQATIAGIGLVPGEPSALRPSPKR
jgi:helicase